LANDFRAATPISEAKLALQLMSRFWYKVSRSKRVSYNGITPASQADNEGSIPFTRSSIYKPFSRYRIPMGVVSGAVSHLAQMLPARSVIPRQPQAIP
jgi:hypothetical protein